MNSHITGSFKVKHRINVERLVDVVMLTFMFKFQKRGVVKVMAQPVSATVSTDDRVYGSG